MREINNLKNCAIFDRFLHDDLRDYTLYDESDSLYIEFPGDRYPVTFNLEALQKIYQDNLFGQTTTIVNMWQPVFVWDDSFITNKMLTKEGAIRNANPNFKSARLGIENFMSFKPRFQHWSVGSDDATLTTDWIINRANLPYYLEYGLLFWYKKLPDEDSVRSDRKFLYDPGYIEDFPNYSRITTTDSLVNQSLNNVQFIKLDNTTLYRIDKDDSQFGFSQTQSIRFSSVNWNQNAIVRVSDIKLSDKENETRRPKFFLYAQSAKNSNEIIGSGSRTTLSIPDGECFSYFENYGDKEVSRDRQMFSKTYISPSLYGTYRQVYNMLTLDYKKEIDSGFNLQKSRMIRKIASYLSTSPIMTELGVNFLDYPLLRQYLIGQIEGESKLSKELEPPSAHINSEIQILKKILLNIHGFLNEDREERITKLDAKLSQNTRNENIVNSRKQLFRKMLNKYGSYLNITKDCDLTYTGELKYGDNINVQQVISNYCEKKLTETEVYNNQSVQIGSLSAETAISLKQESSDKTNILLNKTGMETKIIPLSDLIRNRERPVTLNIEMRTRSNVENRFRKNPVAGVADNRVPEEPDREWDPANYIYYTQNLPFAQARTNETELRFRIFDELLLSDEDWNYLPTGTVFNHSNRPLKFATVRWEQVYGSCLKFSDTNKTPERLAGGRDNPQYNYTRYNNSTQINPNVYVYKTGEYRIKCTVTTPNGTFVKTKTFYVVVGTEVIGQEDIKYFGYYADLNETDPEFTGNERELEGEVLLTLKPPPEDNPGIVVKGDAVPVTIGEDKLKVVCPTMTDIALNTIGMFWPAKTNLSYANETYAEFLDEYSLEGDDKFFFGSGDNEKSGANFTGNPQLKLSYQPNNTKITVSKIGLYNIRNSTPECSQCVSFYRPLMTTQAVKPPPTYITNPNGTITVEPANKQIRNIRNHKGPDGTIDIIAFKVRTPLGDSYIVERQKDIYTFEYPQVSTRHAPQIKPYGGYNQETVQKIGLDPRFVTSEQDIAATGYRLDYAPSPIAGFSYPETEMKACYQKAAKPSTKSFTFKKGLFHPASGWIYHDSPYYPEYPNNNLTSVLKFNPGARDTFSFTGPGLYGMKSSFDSESNNKPKIYQSEIELNISKHIQWDPLFGPCDKGPTEEEREAHRRKNQLTKEYSDQLEENAQSMKHGYRYLNGGFQKLAEITRSNFESQSCDEFGFSLSSNQSCGDGPDLHKFTYSFPVTGPAYPINSENIDKVNLRNPRVNDFAIKDIEVKLNFLNYVNTKNLVVWLDVHFSEHELRALRQRAGNPPPSPIRAGSEFVNQSFPGDTYGLDDFYVGTPHISDATTSGNIRNTKVTEYLNDLVNMNSTTESPQRIYLLNQDHIQNNGYNFTLKFSDHAPNNNVLHDENSENNLGLNLKQNIIRNEYEIQPTISVSGYTDRECSVYSNVIRNNQLNILTNKFAKFKDRILFQIPPPEEQTGATCQYDPTYDSSTRFVLNFAVLNESDEMNILDLTNHNAVLSNYETGDSRIQSSDIESSLCSWELILHVGDAKKPVPTSQNGINNYGASDSLALIEYGKDPSYPGYNFIANIGGSDKDFLPFVNVNAPYPFIFAPNIACDFADPLDRPKETQISRATFPDWAILYILGQIALTTVNAGGGLVGLLMGLTTFNTFMEIGYAPIFAYLRSNKSYQEALDKIRNFYVPKYESYPFGSPEKTLLNVSKDGVFWYKLEASIFRYDNTPALVPNEYNFIRLNKNVMPKFSDWSFSAVKNIRSVIDDNFIRKVTIKCSEDISKKSTAEDASDLIIEKLTDIQTPKNTILYVTFEQSGDLKCSKFDGLYIMDEEKLYRLSQDDEDTENKDSSVAPENILRSNKFVQFNNCIRGSNPLFGNLFGRSFKNEMDSGKIVILDSKLPFYIFDTGNTVEAYSSNTDKEPVTAKILAKGLVFVDNEYHTVLHVDSDISGKGTMSLVDKDCVIVFKPQQTQVLDYPINIWGFEKEKIVPKTPETNYSLNSVGSVGDGSYEVDKEILNYKPNINNLDNLYDILNNSVNDKIKYNSIFVSGIVMATGVIQSVNPDGEITETTGVFPTGVSYDLNNGKSIRGFAINTEEAKNIFLKGGYSVQANAKTSQQQIDEAIDTLEYSVSSSRHNNEIQMMILKSDHLATIPIDETATTNQEGDGTQNGDMNLVNMNYGHIQIEQDFIKNDTINYLGQNDIDKLVNRLNSLENVATEGLEAYIGNKNRTNTIIQYGNINDLTNHYNSLDEDPFECLDRYNSPKNNNTCYKKRTKQALYNAYQERTEIIDLLDIQAQKSIVDGKIIYTAKKNTDRVFTDRVVELSEYDDGNLVVRNNDAIKIKYTDNDKSNFYWINIDPKQSCTLASEMNPRVLTKTEYNCRYAYSDSFTFPANNNVCPRFANGSTGFGTPGTIDGSDEHLDAGGVDFTYSVPIWIVNEQKKKIEEENPGKIEGWTTIQIERVFTVNNDSDIKAAKGGVFIPSQDIIVEAVETYEVALPKQKGYYSMSDDGSADGVDKSTDPDVTTPRLGLMDYTGGRDRTATRVYNVFNLDMTDELQVQFRKIPRMIKGVDYRNTVYRYGVAGSAFRPLVGEVAPVEVSTDSSLNNLFYYWQCLQRNTVGEWKYTDLPDTFKLFNEMMFRGFFGSSDYIEHKSSTLESLYPWEWIPYEYENSQ